MRSEKRIKSFVVDGQIYENFKSVCRAEDVTASDVIAGLVEKYQSDKSYLISEGRKKKANAKDFYVRFVVKINGSEGMGCVKILAFDWPKVADIPRGKPFDSFGADSIKIISVRRSGVLMEISWVVNETLETRHVDGAILRYMEIIGK